MRPIRWWGYLPVVVIFVGVAYFQVELSTHTVVAEEPMTWECTNSTQIYPGPVVLLRFARASEYLRFYADPDGSFCRFISQSGKSTITARSDVWGNRRNGIAGWNEISYDGHTPPASAIVGGTARDSDPKHQEPYAQDFDAALNRAHP